MAIKNDGTEKLMEYEDAAELAKLRVETLLDLFLSLKSYKKEAQQVNIRNRNMHFIIVELRQQNGDLSDEVKRLKKKLKKAKKRRGA